MMDRKTETRMVGPSSGSVTKRMVWFLLAPSTSAASSTSRGMFCSPASMITMWKPKYFHEMITNSVYMTTSGSASQS